VLLVSPHSGDPLLSQLVRADIPIVANWVSNRTQIGLLVGAWEGGGGLTWARAR